MNLSFHVPCLTVTAHQSAMTTVGCPPIDTVGYPHSLISASRRTAIFILLQHQQQRKAQINAKWLKLLYPSASFFACPRTRPLCSDPPRPGSLVAQPRHHRCWRPHHSWAAQPVTVLPRRRIKSTGPPPSKSANTVPALPYL